MYYRYAVFLSCFDRCTPSILPNSSMRGDQGLRDRYAELNAQIHALERRSIRKKLRALIYPVLTLPDEVTSEIFVHCLPPVATEQWPSNPSNSDAPLLLLRICSTWKDIALATPRLWTSFQLTDCRSSRTLDHEHGRQMLSAWVERTASAPLYISLHHHDPVAELSPSLNETRSVPDIFLQIIDHLRDRVQSALTGKLPILKRLAIDVRNLGRSTWAPVSGTTPITAFAKALKLQQVSLIHVPLPLIILPWAQLTRFAAAGAFSVEDCLQDLREAPLLVDCEFNYVHGELPDNPVLLPPLRHLESLVVGSEKCYEILRVVTLPALTKLYLPRYFYFDDHSLFTAFLLRSSPVALQHLVLRGNYECFMQALSSMPGLIDIEITDMRGSQVSRLLSFLGDHPISLPNLQSIHIYMPRLRDDEEPCDLAYDQMVDAVRMGIWKLGR
ncbi:hypothetical protein B0H10DRAFT_2069832 [Mycena sp. CBHHK59/15]|nr:hypothetical protein B0H10DRAFT_2069832 [Mycena sp. CBHHK59/15]